MPEFCFKYDEDTLLSNRITEMENRIMATLQEVKDALAALSATATEEQQEVLAALTALRTEILDLQAQIAAGTAATPADLDELLGTVNGLIGTVEAISEPPVV